MRLPLLAAALSLCLAQGAQRPTDQKRSGDGGAALLTHTEIDAFADVAGAFAHGWMPPPAGVVPDARTATELAIPLFRAAFGETNLRRQLPLRAGRLGHWWLVLGTPPPHTVGGVGFLVLRDSDAAVLALTVDR